MKDKDLALRVAGVVFMVVAIMHLLRLLLRAQIDVGGMNVRSYVSMIGFVVALLMAIWMFKVSKK